MLIIDPHPAFETPSIGIVKAERIQAFLDVADVVDAAREIEAEQLVDHKEQLLGEVDQAVRTAYRDGFAHFATAAEELAEAKQELVHRFSDNLRECLQTAFKTCPPKAFVTDMLTPLFDKLDVRTDVTVVVPKGRIDDFQHAIDDLYSSDSEKLNLTIQPSTDASDTDVVVYTQSEVFDLSIPVIVERLLNSVSWTDAGAAIIELESEGLKNAK